MNRRTLDIAAGLVIAAVFVIGLFLTWDAFQEYQDFADATDHRMGGGHGASEPLHPLWHLLGTLLVTGVLGASYAVLRGQLFPGDGANTSADATGQTPQGNATTQTSPEDTTSESAPALDTTVSGSAGSRDAEDDTYPVREILDVLPDDERQVLKPVFESPGLTQIELRDRADFSKSKVSQTVTDLEKRGLLYREPQGRTYRVYPADDIGPSDARDDTPDAEK